MNAFAIFTYAAIVQQLQAGYGVLMSHLSLMQWYELSFYMTLQFENGKAYAAVLSTPEITEGDRTHNSLEDDIYFEETHEGMKR